MKKLLLAIPLCIFSLTGFSQQTGNWVSNPEDMPGNIKAFQENKGQFVNTVNNWTVLYGCDYEGTRTLFTNHGVIYIIPEVVKTGFEETDNKERKIQKKENKRTVLHAVIVEWENTNNNLSVEPIDVTPFYFGSIDPVNAGKSIDNIKGFKKLVFHNVQPGIDIEYTFHPKTGLKYSVIIHPGYNAGAFKMKYSGQSGLSLNESGDLHIATPMGDIVDHAPISSQNGATIESSFKQLQQNEVAFDLKNANSKTDLIIDPWTVSPITGSILPSDIGMDSLSNTYILGSGTDSYVQKYSPTGSLSWTYTLSQYGAFSNYVSALAVDMKGNTYIPMPYGNTNAAGGYYGLLCLNTSGSLIYYNNTNPLANPKMFEVWSLVFSPKDSVLIEAGAPNIEQYELGLVNSANGNLGTETIDTLLGEIYTACIAPNGKYYGISSNPCFGCNTPGNNIVCYTVNKSQATLAWNRPTKYQWNDFDNKNPNGIASNWIAAGRKYLYTTDGLTLHQRSLSNGDSLKSITIPGGSNTAGASPGGLAVDVCGNVYVGTINSVLVYDSSLNLLTTHSTSSAVYGIACSNALVSACGGVTGNGFVTQFATTNSPCDTILTSINTIVPNKNTFEVFPNPSNGLFNIRTSYDNNTIVEVYNSLGQFITQKKVLNGQGSLDLSGESNGIYCLRVLNNNKYDHFNIVVSH